MVNRQVLTNLFRILITLLAFLWLITSFDLSNVWQNVKTANPLWLLFTFLILQVSMVLRAYRWQRLLHHLDVQVKLRSLVSLYYTGQFYGIVLPSGFAGDLFRVLEFDAAYKRDQIAGSVLLDRASGLTAMLGIGLFTLPFGRHLLDDATLALAVLVCGGGFLAGILLLDGHVPRWVLGVLPRNRFVGIRSTLERVLGVEQASRRGVWEAFAISILYSSMVILIHFMVGQGYDVDVNLTGFAMVVPLFSIAQLMPSIQGIGFTESIYVTMLSSATVSEEALIAVSLTVHAGNILTGIIGGFQYLYAAIRRIEWSSP